MPMTTFHDIQEQVEAIDVQIIALLATRAKLYAGLDPNEIDADVLADTIALWIEEAGEHGLPESVMEKMAKLVLVASKRIEE